VSMARRRCRSSLSRHDVVVCGRDHKFTSLHYKKQCCKRSRVKIMIT
jgi:hypothetical protein